MANFRNNVSVGIDDFSLTIMKVIAGEINKIDTPPEEISYIVIYEDAMGEIIMKVSKFKELESLGLGSPESEERTKYLEAIKALTY